MDRFRRWMKAQTACLDSPDSISVEWVSSLMETLPEDLKAEIDYRPHDARWWSTTGELLLDDPPFTVVEAMWRKALTLDSRQAEPWALLSEVMEERGQFAEAEACLRQALEREPLAFTWWCRLGDCLAAKAGESGEAEAAFRRALEICGTDSRPWYGLARLLEQQSETLEEAAEAWKKVIDYTERDSDAWHPLARVLLKLGRRAEAEDAWSRGMRFDGETLVGWMRPSEGHADDMRRLSEMEGAWRRAAALDPEFAGPWAGLAEVLSKFPAHDPAEESTLTMDIALDLNDVQKWIRMGSLFQCRDRFEEAREAYRKALVLFPAHPAAQNGLDILLAQRRLRDAQAEEAFREALSTDPKSLPAWHALASLLSGIPARSKDAEDAIRTVAKLAGTSR